MTLRTTLALMVALILPIASVTAQDGSDARPYEVGMAKTFFNDLPDTFVNIAIQPFAPLMKKMTTYAGRMNPGEAPAELARKLNGGQTQIGVFNGFEFAWAQEKYPDLQPVLVAVNRHRDVRAFIVVHKDSPAKSASDLAGKTLAMALGTREYCRLYVDRKCGDNNGGYFKIEKSKSYEDALDDVGRQKVDAAVVDTISLEFYKDVHGPRFSSNMRILQQSEGYPAAVLAVKKGTLSAATVTQFCNGLMKMREDRDGIEMMKMLNIHAFEAVPPDYQQSLTSFLKLYPARQPWKVALR